MTYGWAILAAIVAIGVLSYFGVFSPGKITGNRIVVNNPFYAGASQVIVTTSDINMELVNNGGNSLQISSITVTGTGEFSGVTCTNSAISTIFEPNTNNVVNIPCSTGTLSSGGLFVGDIIINYHKVGDQLTQSTSGKMASTIQ